MIEKVTTASLSNILSNISIQQLLNRVKEIIKKSQSCTIGNKINADTCEEANSENIITLV
jgi:hypothetical protein